MAVAFLAYCQVLLLVLAKARLCLGNWHCSQIRRLRAADRSICPLFSVFHGISHLSVALICCLYRPSSGPIALRNV